MKAGRAARRQVCGREDVCVEPDAIAAHGGPCVIQAGLPPPNPGALCEAGSHVGPCSHPAAVQVRVGVGESVGISEVLSGVCREGGWGGG